MRMRLDSQSPRTSLERVGAFGGIRLREGQRHVFRRRLFGDLILFVVVHRRWGLEIPNSCAQSVEVIADMSGDETLDLPAGLSGIVPPERLVGNAK